MELSLVSTLKMAAAAAAVTVAALKMAVAVMVGALKIAAVAAAVTVEALKMADSNSLLVKMVPKMAHSKRTAAVKTRLFVPHTVAEILVVEMAAEISVAEIMTAEISVAEMQKAEISEVEMLVAEKISEAEIRVVAEITAAEISVALLLVAQMQSVLPMRDSTKTANNNKPALDSPTNNNRQRQYHHQLHNVHPICLSTLPCHNNLAKRAKRANLTVPV